MSTALCANLAAASSAAAHAGQREYLSFKLGAEEYGIDILRMQEIRGHEAPTRIAKVPEFIKGVAKLRGVIVPIVDMRVRFGLANVQYCGLTVDIVLNLGSRIGGMVVDAVSDVLEHSGEQSRPAPEFKGAIDATFITGLGSVRSGDTLHI